MPSCGSSAKVIAIAARGLTKYERIRVRSASPMAKTDIPVLARHERIIARIQTSLLFAAEVNRAEVATIPCAPFGTTVVILFTAIGLAAGEAGRTMRGIGALAVTAWGRGGSAAGA